MVVGFAVAVTAGIARLLTQDGWLALVAGREIVRHGLPTYDRLTIWSNGRRWVDQQWLGQLALYGVHAVGGLRLLLVFAAVIAVATFGLAVVAARTLGGSPRSTGVVAAVALVPLISTTSARTQLLATVLFLATLWLLVSEARRPSRRVYLVLPLLALWANVHGSVVIGAALAVLAGVALGWEQKRVSARAAVLCVAPVACVFASPYAGSLPTYYRDTLFNREFGRVVTEWHATTPSLANAPVYLLALATLWLLVRAGRRVTLFERAALALSFVVGFAAVRNVGWPALASLLVLPHLLDAALAPRERPRLAPVRMGLVVASAVGAAAAGVALLHSPSAAIAEQFPPRASAAVARALEASPRATIFAEDRYADWLLWRVPAARGRVVFDARFELLTKARLEQLSRWASMRTPGWRSAAAGAALAVVSPRRARALTHDGAVRIYMGRNAAVVTTADRQGVCLVPRCGRLGG